MSSGSAAQLAQYLSKLETMGRRPVQVGKNAATNDLKAYLFADLGLPILKQTDTGKPLVDAAAQASSTQIYHAYTQYCRDGGLKPVSQKRFLPELEAEHKGVQRLREYQTRRMLYQGIALVDTEK